MSFGLSDSLSTPFASGALNWPTGPAADIVGKPTCYEITVELPGMDEKNIEVKVADGTLTIRGERRHEREEPGEGYYLAERRFGAFERAFRLPQGVDAGRIEAVLRNGVLTLTLPKSPEAKAETTIAVQAA
ncbi:Hsp20/alpha crystallin family protein [Methylobacterium sp. Leaf123]|uniref:Hsp20/alpha crystallin family protein n=1 Tax=Methylobacterium sp. Leaf123 TaxID=1736264 RepID=UPI002570C379|nr:Hsp20/alpha crystallin family protein [Methylobacterium sp. Leaf123]